MMKFLRSLFLAAALPFIFSGCATGPVATTIFGTEYPRRSEKT